MGQTSLEKEREGGGGKKVTIGSLNVPERRGDGGKKWGVREKN